MGRCGDGVGHTPWGNARLEHTYTTKQDRKARSMKCVWLLFACVDIGFFWVMFLVGRISAEETTCQSLASWYAANPSQLNCGSLAALRSCVAQTIGAKNQQQQQGGWPEDSETQRPDSGGWPNPPAWSDGKTESKPWDRD
jgi:hypothetical protein